MSAYTQSVREGMYELTESARAELVGSKYYNKDLAPTSLSERTWNTYHISMLWVGMAICMPSFMMASGAVGFGLSCWAAVLCVILGNLIILVPMQLNSHAGTKYGIPFPVFSRMTFGIKGAHIPSVSRGITACGWNMVQSVTGGGALLFMVKAIVPSFNTLSTGAQVCAFLVFLFISGLLTSGGSVVIRIFEAIGSPILIAMGVALFIWALVIGSQNDFTLGQILVSEIRVGEQATGSAALYWFLFALNGNIGFWATMALNIPDFSRFAKNQKTQFNGQLFGMVPGMAFCAVIGAVYAQTTLLVYGVAQFNPVDVLQYFPESPIMRIAAFMVGIFVIIATLTTNIAANIVAPANGFSNLTPKRISYKTGTWIACLIAVVYYVPFVWAESFANFMFTFLNVYGGLLGPLAAIFIADYYIIKKRNIDVMSLFKGSDSRYWYKGGFNVHAMIAWFFGFIVPTLVALIPALHDITVLDWINGSSYLFSFFVALIVYMLIMPKNHPSFISGEEEDAITEKIA